MARNDIGRGGFRWTRARSFFRSAFRRLARLRDQSWCCEGARAGAEAIFIAAKTCDVRWGKPLGAESVVQPLVLSSFCCIRCFVFRPAVLCVQPHAEIVQFHVNLFLCLLPPRAHRSEFPRLRTWQLKSRTEGWMCRRQARRSVLFSEQPRNSPKHRFVRWADHVRCHAVAQELSVAWRRDHHNVCIQEAE